MGEALSRVRACVRASDPAHSTASMARKRIALIASPTIPRGVGAGWLAIVSPAAFVRTVRLIPSSFLPMRKRMWFGWGGGEPAQQTAGEAAGGNSTMASRAVIANRLPARMWKGTSAQRQKATSSRCAMYVSTWETGATRFSFEVTAVLSRAQSG